MVQDVRDVQQIAQQQMLAQIEGIGKSFTGKYESFNGARDVLMRLACLKEGRFNGQDMPILKGWEKEMSQSNAVARALRENPRLSMKPPAAHEVMGRDAYMKSVVDVGTATDLAALSGGQVAGIPSIDFKVARGTVRPKSFTLYNMLNKTMANQIVDFWPYIGEKGSGMPGSAFTAFSSQTTVLAPNNGSYQMKYLNLKLACDPRAVTMALANQASYFDIQEQEEANGGLTILESVNWSAYYGNPNLFPNQPQGIFYQIPSKNFFDFQQYASNPAVVAEGLSQEQVLFNLIYEVQGKIGGYHNYGAVTHAFMTPATVADLSQLVTTQLRNIVNGMNGNDARIVVNGDLHGMRGRFGDIQFAMDFYISAREAPAQAIQRDDNSLLTYANTALAPATSVAGTPITAAAVQALGVVSDFNAAYAQSGNVYTYAVAACDQYMNESNLTYSTPVSGVALNGGVALTITPNGATTQAFRIYRSGLGYNATSSQNPAAFRFIGSVVANGSSPVTFNDVNGHIPGSDNIFLLDLDESDNALDYRYLLPLSKIDLYAQALFMPFTIAHIGAPRVRVPKFHAVITNYVPLNPVFNPLGPNVNAAYL